MGQYVDLEMGIHNNSLEAEDNLFLLAADEYAALCWDVVWVVLYLQMLPNRLSVRESQFMNILNYKCKRKLETS